MATQSINLPAEIYATLTGNIDPAAAQRVMTSIRTASMNNVKKAHILIQSTGGGIGEGIGLYNLFRKAPIDLAFYNGGSIASIAVVAYLGAKNRKTSRNAMFTLHRTQTTTQAATTKAMKVLTENAILFDRNMEEILREHIDMPAEKWSALDEDDLWLSAENAVKYGIADEIADFAPRVGTKIFTI